MRRVARHARRPEHLPVGHAQLADPPVGRSGVDRRARRIGDRRRGRDLRRAGQRRVRRRREAPEHGSARRVDRLGPAVGRGDEEDVVGLAVHGHVVQVDRRRVDRAVERHLAADELRDVGRRDAGHRRAGVVARSVVAEAVPVGAPCRRRARRRRNGEQQKQRRARRSALIGRSGPGSSPTGRAA